MPSNMMTAGNGYCGYLSKNQPWFRDTKISSRIFRLNFVWKTTFFGRLTIAIVCKIPILTGKYDSRYEKQRMGIRQDPWKFFVACLGWLSGLFGLRWPPNDPGIKKSLVSSPWDTMDFEVWSNLAKIILPVSFSTLRLARRFRSLWCAQCFVRKFLSVA